MSQAPSSIKSSRRPGVATTMSTPRRNGGQAADGPSGLARLLRLHRQLARRGDDKYRRLRKAAPGLALVGFSGLLAVFLAPGPPDAHEPRQRKRQGFPGARLGDADDVQAGHADRPSAGLDRRRPLEPVAHGQQFRREPGAGKLRHGCKQPAAALDGYLVAPEVLLRLLRGQTRQLGTRLLAGRGVIPVRPGL
ncbi:MAG: hypothetical protein BJ554DRAFT_1224 [Olpidium bornovanus]|uniref:Uncharacterized protein n=1 Tax=Olpidium bornovanus TaxID=278681 RepID=A0A8H7ZS65_9FUNG|nr:MAG: hypothetical protein BJ554DRAFT_1224 [Olpidium bornovanus]